MEPLAWDQFKHDDMTRLSDELEQARAALEVAHAGIAALTKEREALERQMVREQSARLRAESAAISARIQAVKITCPADRPRVPNGDLQTLLEKAFALTEELRPTNEALLAANHALDQIVAERTEELNRANAELARLNEELTRRIEAETAAAAKAQAELFQMQKLDAVGQLTGGVAHDFNNLLGVIIGGLELLGRLPAERHERILRRIEEAAWRGAQLTQRLLTFSRRQMLRPERLDLAAHMENMRDLFARTLRQNIEVRTEVAPGVWPIEADPAALELALLNLAVNARDAMPDGGTLLLTARNRPLSEQRASRLSLAPGDYVELEIADTGSGMPPEVLARVFEPFFTTKTGNGNGLGLAQVYGFVKQSDGGAWVESAQGNGTTVRLLLPRSAREETIHLPDRSHTPSARHAEHLHVLVVEDDDELAASVLDMLGQLGHHGTRVITVAAALTELSYRNDPVDLVLSDVLLPGGSSGLDLARELSRRSNGVPMILTSGYGGGMTQRLAAANVPFLRKPYRLETLRQAIDNAMPVGLPPIAQAAQGR